MAGEFKIKNGAIVAPLAGNDGFLVSVDNDGLLQVTNPATFATSGDILSLEQQIANISGGGLNGPYVTTVNNISGAVEIVAGTGISISGSGQQLIISTVGQSSGIQGRLTLNNTDKVYTITHPSINPAEEYPVVSLDIPTSGSDLFVVGIFDRQATSFKVELSGVPTSDYGLLWHISTQETVSISGGSSLTVSSISGSNVVYNILENINSLRFDADGGFDVIDLGGGSAKITMNSTFKTWKVDGQDDLVATGLDTIEFVAGNGITIETSASADPQQIIFNAEVSSQDVTGLELRITDLETSVGDISSSLDDFANKLEIVNVTTTTSITEFDKVYSLQGTGSYTVTLPEADSGNLNGVIYLYKEGNSNLDEFITLQTTGGQEIRANRQTYTTLQFRFTGEAIILIAHGNHWDVLGEANVFNSTIKVSDQTSFINAIRKLNFLNGGTVVLSSEVLINQTHTIDLTGIRIFGDSGTGTQIRFSSDAVRFTVTGAGFYFDSVRFTGVRTNRGSGTSQYFLEIVSNGVNAGKFENCVFRDIVTRTQNTTNGNIRFTRDDVLGGSGWNITFTDCDIFSGGSGNGDGLHFVNGSTGHAFFNIFFFGHKRFTENFNLMRFTGNTITGNNGNGYTDAGVIFDATPSDDRFTNKFITAQRPLITYQTEKTTIANNDQILVSSTANNGDLRRITFQNLTADLATQSDISDFITTAEVASISSSLESQISAKQDSITLVEGSNVTIIEDPQNTWTISANISGGGGFTPIAGEGIVITPSGSDYVFSVDDYISSSQVASISSGLDGRIDVLEQNPIPDIFRAEVADISANLQQQISAIEEEQTIIVGGEGIEVIENPTHTWTISVTGDYVLKSGDTMTGNLNISGSDIKLYDATNETYISPNGLEFYADSLGSGIYFYYDIANEQWVWENYAGRALSIRDNRVIEMPGGTDISNESVHRAGANEVSRRKPTINFGAVTTTTDFDLIPHNTDRATIKYILQLDDGTNLRSSEIMATYIGSTVTWQEYAINELGTPITGASWSVESASGNIVIRLTVTSGTYNVRIMRERLI